VQSRTAISMKVSSTNLSDRELNAIGHASIGGFIEGSGNFSAVVARDADDVFTKFPFSAQVDTIRQWLRSPYFSCDGGMRVRI